MASNVLSAGRVSRPRLAALSRHVRGVAYLNNLNHVRDNHVTENVTEFSVQPYQRSLPAVSAYSDHITRLNDDQVMNVIINNEEQDFIQHLKRQNFLRQYRMEWLRYNLAMKDCSEEIFLASSGEKDPVLDRSKQRAKLYEMRDYLAEHLRTFFAKTHNYSIYHTDLVFENNYYDPPRITKGIDSYILQLNKYRWLAGFRYAHAKLDVLNIKAEETDYSIRVRWRISGLSNKTIFMRFWKFFPGRYRKSVSNEADWHDGYSIFHLNREGAIIKHVVERIVPDDEVAVETKKSGLAAKFAVLSFLLPESPFAGD